MEEHGFVLLNGRCHPDTSGKFTFFGAQGLSVVDLVWVNTASIDLITEFSVDQSAYRSDHYPIVVKVATKAHKPHMRPPPNVKQSTTRLKWDQSAVSTFQQAMRWSPLAMFDNKDLSANSLNTNIANAVHQAAESTGMLSTNSGIWKPCT